MKYWGTAHTSSSPTSLRDWERAYIYVTFASYTCNTRVLIRAHRIARLSHDISIGLQLSFVTVLSSALASEDGFLATRCLSPTATELFCLTGNLFVSKDTTFGLTTIQYLCIWGGRKHADAAEASHGIGTWRIGLLQRFLDILRGVILDWLGWTTGIRFCIFKIRWKVELDIDDCFDREEFQIHICSTTYALHICSSKNIRKLSSHHNHLSACEDPNVWRSPD